MQRHPFLHFPNPPLTHIIFQAWLSVRWTRLSYLENIKNVRGYFKYSCSIIQGNYTCKQLLSYLYVMQSCLYWNFSRVNPINRSKDVTQEWRYLVKVKEKAMAPHSSTLAWKIPWMEEPGRLQSMGSLRVGHDWATSLSLFTFMNWRRKWQPTPVFLPGESQGRRSLVGCRLWGCTESDMTEAT